MISFNELGYYGRFGNQMFQYAALRGIAAKHGYAFCIPESSIAFNFDHYAYSPCIHSNIIGKGEGHLLSLAFELPAAIHQRPVELLRCNFVNEVKEDDSPLELCPDGVTLHGYFQDERYFKHIADDIRKDFTFKAPIREWCADKLRDTVQTKCFSIHVRRGDYIQLGLQLLNLDYYEKAMQEFDSSWAGLVFSDDPQWCMQQELFQDDRFTVLDIPDTVHSMCLMHMCDGHIIANSSFSWWAAWLGGGKCVRSGDICHA